MTVAAAAEPSPGTCDLAVVRAHAEKDYPDYRVEVGRGDHDVVTLLFAARQGDGAFAIAVHAIETRLSTSMATYRIDEEELRRVGAPLATWWQDVELQRTLAACSSSERDSTDADLAAAASNALRAQIEERGPPLLTVLFAWMAREGPRLLLGVAWLLLGVVGITLGGVLFLQLLRCARRLAKRAAERRRGGSPGPEVDGEKRSVFERNSRKTIFSLILATVCIADFVSGTVIARRTQAGRGLGVPNRFYHHGLRRMGYAVQRWGPHPFPVYTDSLGLVDFTRREVSLAPPPGKRRILLVGDSFLEGLGFAYPDTVGGVMSGALGPNYEVLNAGVSGYSPKLYYLKVKYLVERAHLEVNRLVVFIDVADVSDEVGYDDWEPDSDGPDIENSLLGDFVYGILREHSVIIPFLLEWQRERQERNAWAGRPAPLARPKRWKHVEDSEKANWMEEPPPAWRDEGLRLAAENMDRLCELARRRAVPVTIVIYPWPEHIRAGRIDCMQQVVWKKFAAEHGAGFIDLFPVFLAGDREKTIAEDFIPGDVHWSIAGARMVAELVSREMLSAEAAQGHP